MQGYEEWQSEIDIFGRFSHPNLVKLLGYCSKDSNYLIVYEYMRRGSLDNHLFRCVVDLPWEMRIKVAIDAASGLQFLHTQGVVHEYFNSANILLDGELYDAKIYGFGIPPASQSHARVMGNTRGYAAPEYKETCYPRIESDVYSFGVVLVELLTGQRASETWFQTDKPILVDSRLEEYPSKAARETAKLALRCLDEELRNRPPMTEVVKVLKEIQQIGIKNRRQPDETLS